MRRFDKRNIITEANQRLEREYIKSKTLIKEDILELKQMSKQIYSYLKKKGYEVKMKTEKGESRKSFDTNLDLNDTIQLVIQEGTEVVMIALPVRAVVKKLTGDKDLNSSTEADKYGKDFQDWYVNKEVTNYVDKLGDELVSQLKSKYPTMRHGFDKDDSRMFYFMRFGYGRNKKGGDIK
tara:strand:+ start:626 stop:1165 length:540 start_codon:yes stop_codon:yes gene_type:complete